MADYYEILEVPVDAAWEQVKARYRLLVRIYHPDRFSDPGTKSYVEKKLTEINQAYAALLEQEQTRAIERVALPQPLLSTEQLDFGTVHQGNIQTQIVRIENTGGPAQQVNLQFSDPQPWFQVGQRRRIFSASAFPLEFPVILDTRTLAPNHNYAGWIDVYLDDVATRINVTARVVAPKYLGLLAPLLDSALGSVPTRVMLIGLMLVFILSLVFLRLLDTPYITFASEQQLTVVGLSNNNLTEKTTENRAAEFTEPPPSPTPTGQASKQFSNKASVPKVAMLVLTSFPIDPATPMPTATLTAVAVPPAATATTQPTLTPTIESTHTTTPEPAATATNTSTATPEPTVPPTITPTHTATPEPAATTTSTSTATPLPTATATATTPPTPTATFTPTATPIETELATETPVAEPTATKLPTLEPPLPTANAPKPTLPLLDNGQLYVVGAEAVSWRCALATAIM